MKAKTKIRNCLAVGLLAGFMLCALTLLPSKAQAAAPNYCYLLWTLPNQEVFSPFGANRSSKRAVPYHAGVDVCMPVGTPVPVPRGAMTAAEAKSGSTQPCHIVLNGAGNPIHNNPGGFGFYIRYDCGNGVEVMMAHMNGFSGNTQSGVSGQEGNACGGASGPHVHLEVFIDRQVVDPQCVFGLPKGPYHGKPQGPGNARTAQCNGALAGGPLNLCELDIRNALKKDGRDRVPITRYPPGTSAPPTQFSAGTYGKPLCTKQAKPLPNCKIDHSQVPPQPDPNKPGYTGDPNVNTDEDVGGHNPIIDDTIDDTGLIIDPGDPVGPGDPGGEETPGRRGPKAQIPPLIPNNEPLNSSCAVDTMVALTNQSVMEARREDMVNKRFIAKADSVIAYGCLPMYLKKTETDLAAIFSETDRWVNRSVDLIGKTHIMNKTLGPMSMDSALVNVITAAQISYGQNFNHPLLGGLEGYGELANPEQCKDMQKVWDVAKCQNFPAPDEVFLGFKDLISNDLRKFPTAVCTDTGIDQGMIDAAKNQATKFDKVKPRFDWLGTEDDCKAPIGTGITIHRHEQAGEDSEGYVATVKTYEDAVCSNAGCRYDNPDLSGMGTCKKD